MIEMKVTGLDKILEALKSLPDAVSEQIVEDVFVEMVQPTLERARALAPVDSGFLKSQIRVAALSANGYVTVQVGVYSPTGPGKKASKTKRAKFKAAREKTAYYARWVENGTSKMRARPFLRPAFDETVTGFVEGASKALGKKIEEHWGSTAA